jgi:hypothetical protein
MESWRSKLVSFGTKVHFEFLCFVGRVRALKQHDDNMRVLCVV